MVFAFGHIIGAWLVGKLVELATKNKISQNTWFFLILGGILPDVDFVLQLVFKVNLHRGITHSVFFAIISAVVIYSILRLIKEKKAWNYSLFLALGILTHLFLDLFSVQGVPLLWPYAKMFIPSFSLETYSSTLDATIDMFLGTSWIFYLWFKQKIQF